MKRFMAIATTEAVDRSERVFQRMSFADDGRRDHKATSAPNPSESRLAKGNTLNCANESKPAL